MKFRSLHARLVAGGLVWGAALLTVAFAIVFVFVQYRPRTIATAHYTLVVLGAAIFASVGVSVIRSGLSPFRMLRERLADVHAGRTARLEGEYPTEVEPLVKDLNALLDEREHRVARAVARAGDLAHGLKTPLAVIAQDIERADAAGQHEVAASLRRQVERMRRQIESHLAHARVTAAGVVPNARADVADAASGLARTMERLFAERALAITLNIPRDLVVRVSGEDLEEMLGNLMDNACKWARSRVDVSATITGSNVTIVVDDDGMGLEPSMREHVLRRGVRLDEESPGSGLGLAIARDLAHAYSGTLVLEASPFGGVRARLTLPAQ